MQVKQIVAGTVIAGALGTGGLALAGTASADTGFHPWKPPNITKTVNSGPFSGNKINNNFFNNNFNNNFSGNKISVLSNNHITVNINIGGGGKKH